MEVAIINNRNIFFDHMNKVDPAKKINLLWKLLLTH